MVSADAIPTDKQAINETHNVHTILIESPLRFVGLALVRVTKPIELEAGNRPYEAELREYLTTGQWHKTKPGLIVSVFEGYRNSSEILHPLIERHGFIGWYWIIIGFINTPVPKQLSYADHHDIDMLTHEYSDGCYALNWDVLQGLLIEGQAPGNLVSDAHLAALAAQHGCTLTYTDGDFARFPKLKWTNPLW